MKTFYYASILLLLSCGQQKTTNQFSSADTLATNYARGFSIIRHPDCFEAIIKNPWQGAQNVTVRYLLSKNPEQVTNHAGMPVIRIPIRRAVCLSTTHIAMIDAISETESIAGISGKYLVSNKTVLEKIKNGKAFDVGYQNNLNYELLLGMKPDVIFAYGIGNEFASYVKKLRDLGFAVVFNAEYLENEPLAKTEWVKFMALFYDKYDTACRMFDTICHRYNAMKKLTSSVAERPAVLYGLPWNGTWHMAGGESYAARMIRDAGGNFLWADTKSHEALPLSIETVIAKADSADIWINTGAALSRADIAAVEKRLSNLTIFKNGKIYNNNAILTAEGGNDYWESGVMMPDVILSDLIKIFHPGLLPDHHLYFYKKL